MTSKLPILGIDASRYPLSENVTGVELYTKHILDGLLKTRLPFRLRLYVKQELNLPKASNQIEQTVIKRKYLWTRLGLSRELKRNPIDILFVPSHTIPSHAPRKTLVVIHGLEASHFPKAYSLFQRLYQRYSTRLAVRKASHLLAVSRAVKQDLVKFYACSSRKIYVIHNGFDAKPFASFCHSGPVSCDVQSEVLCKGLNLGKAWMSGICVNKKNSLPSLGVKGQAPCGIFKGKALETYGSIIPLPPGEDKGVEFNTPYLLTIGRLEERKNQLRLVQAFSSFVRKNPTYRLVLAGPDGHGAQKIHNLIRQLNLQNSVLTPGSIPHNQIPTLLQNATALVYPSLHEGFGFPVLEAFASQTPVLCSRTGSLPEIAGPAALFVNPLSVNSIAQGLEKITHDTRLRKHLASQGQKQLSRFSWEKCVRETKQILLSLAQ